VFALCHSRINAVAKININRKKEISTNIDKKGGINYDQ
jgi:hypothetical protein